MPISSSCVTHFTHDKDALAGILQNNFKIKYCRESNIFGNRRLDYYVPMVSFCEIPLSQIKNHLGSYGNYGLGLSKTWARRQGLNPVFYLEQGSALSRNLLGMFDFATTDHASEVSKLSQFQEAFVRLSDILRYIKNYEGDLVRRSETVPGYRFADEREWRYIPDVLAPNVENIFAAAMPQEFKNAQNEKLGDLRLEFEPDDIRYIFIKDESEIPELIKVLDETKGDKFNKRTIEKLTTRIITTDQILTDF